MAVRITTFLFGILLLAIIAFANSGAGREWVRWIHDIPGGDKLGHFILFGTLAFLLNLWITRPGIRLFRVMPVTRVSLILAFIVTFEEATQILLRSRSFSLVDLLADYAGIALFGALGAVVAKRNETPAPAMPGPRPSSP